ncbi:MAG: cation-transporting P-type ATPase, partial [Nitrospira sp.]|nr:cation-transporting P-type ATPase [Nitrospira sp.]
MTVTKLFVGEKVFDVTGEGYEPVGEIRETLGVRREKPSSASDPSLIARDPSHLSEELRQLLTASVLCNGATLKQEEGNWKILGDPTEGALLVAAAKAGLRMEKLEPTHQFLGEVPFDPERKMMTIVRQSSDGPVAYVKGAPDVLLGQCTHRLGPNGTIEPLSDSTRTSVLDANAQFAHHALRVLGLGQRRLPRKPDSYHSSELEQQLV